VVRADQQRRALGQAQLLHDRLGEAHRLVGDHAPQQVAFLDVGQQFGHAVEQLAVHRAVALVALEELLAQGLEAVGFGSMAKVTATMARAPPEITSRCLSSIGGRPRSASIAWQMAMKSGAVSSRVPSMSKRTARKRMLIPRAGSGSCS
jgi:hypothetical protein